MMKKIALSAFNGDSMCFIEEGYDIITFQESRRREVRYGVS